MTHERSTGAVPIRKVYKRHQPARPSKGSEGGAFAAAPKPRPERAAPRPPPLRTILVPVDGTPAAEHALPFALALARRSGAEVTLTSVYSTLQAASDPERLGWRGGEYLVEPLREYLDALAGRLREAHPVRVRTLPVKGYWPADTLCEMADWSGFITADLIVMGSRRRGWWSRLWHRSVSAEVARRSRAPVLLVPAPNGPPDLSAEPPLARVLIPLDGSARAERVLGPAVSLATLWDGGCDLLHVVRSRPYAVDWSLAYGGPPTGTPARPTWEASRYLRGVAGRLRGLSVPTRWRVMADERPTAEAIARYARLGGADVIALASRGGGGWSGLLRGSLALRAARRTPVPVLICRSA